MSYQLDINKSISIIYLILDEDKLDIDIDEIIPIRRIMQQSFSFEIKNIFHVRFNRLKR